MAKLLARSKGEIYDPQPGSLAEGQAEEAHKN